jgi:hypothetical protein
MEWIESLVVLEHGDSRPPAFESADSWGILWGGVDGMRIERGKMPRLPHIDKQEWHTHRVI